jgi:hypothetical protein
MANKYIVTERCYRDGAFYEPTGESKSPVFFFCENEDVKKHCDSRALKPADKETEDAILKHAPESGKAKLIAAERKKAAEEAEAEKKAARGSGQEAASGEVAIRQVLRRVYGPAQAMGAGYCRHAVARPSSFSRAR